MKGLIFKAGFLVLGAFALPMVLPGPDGEPMMTWDDWIPWKSIRQVERLTEQVGDSMQAVGTGDAASGEIYRWVDAEGVVHYSDTYVEGAETAPIDHVDLAIPAKQFVHHGMVEAKKERSGPAAFFIGDKGDSKRKSAPTNSLKDVEALISGDLSNADEVLKNLPQILEQAQQARQKDPLTR